MSWNFERIELLRKLWHDGISASRIALQLGAGITRNAVIGKVHRLGLSSRPRPVAASPAVRRPRRVETTRNAVVVQGNTMVLMDVIAEEPEPMVWPEAVVIPISERVAIMELRPDMCRWPLGDPLTPEFRYCGTQCDPAVPYCVPHGRIAYQQAPDRKSRTVS